MAFLLSHIPVIIAVVIVLIFVILFARGYVKAPPDQAYIISGIQRESRVLIGRAGLRIPFFERLDKLYLGLV